MSDIKGFMFTAKYLSFAKVSVMNKQSKISAFFSSPSQKRLMSTENCVNNAMKRRKISPKKSAEDAKNEKENQEETTPKKTKVESTSVQSPDGASGDAGSSLTSALSPEQKQRAEKSKLQAQMKLAEKQSHGLLQNMGESWFQALQPEFNKPYFIQLSKFVESERKKNTIYPPAHQVFSFTNMSELNNLKVVILGQDPYHGPGQAHGLCFSVLPGVPPPPSLVNMYKELETDIDGFEKPGHGYLGGWAQQGVLLLNAVLTVKAHNANSHKSKGWEKFTDAIVSHINRSLEGVVFILWGGYAQKKGAHIDKKRHHVIKGAHPSPLSAHRGFFGCKHFSQCNKLLTDVGKTPIDWAHLPLPDA